MVSTVPRCLPNYSNNHGPLLATMQNSSKIVMRPLSAPNCRTPKNSSPGINRILALVLKFSNLMIETNTAYKLLEPRIGAQRIEARPQEDARVKSPFVSFSAANSSVDPYPREPHRPTAI